MVLSNGLLPISSTSTRQHRSLCESLAIQVEMHDLAAMAFVLAHETQSYFGTIIQQDLDRCHAHFRGAPDLSTRGHVPDGGRILPDPDIRSYFDDLRLAERAKVAGPPPPSDIIVLFRSGRDRFEELRDSCYHARPRLELSSPVDRQLMVRSSPRGHLARYSVGARYIDDPL